MPAAAVALPVLAIPGRHAGPLAALLRRRPWQHRSMPSRRAPAGKAGKRAPADPAARLAKYQAMRDFGRTPEPSGGPAPAAAEEAVPGQRRFVVQRHRARRRHYDLRFEIDGVLASWAVPNGPTLDPKARRLAVHVEDHPIEYIDFEGVIPEGEYGGGDVIVWDIGTWEPHETDDPVAAVAAGELHVDVHRAQAARAADPGAQRARGPKQWLLLHKNDDDAVPGWDAEDHPLSVLSGRTNDEVKADPDRMWRSDLPPTRRRYRFARGRTGRTSPGRTMTSSLRSTSSAATGRWQVFGRQLKLTNLDKDLFPAPGRRARGHQARADPVRRGDRAGDPAVPGGPAAEHAPVPRRRGRVRVLAQAAARARARLGAALAQPRGRAGQD